MIVAVVAVVLLYELVAVTVVVYAPTFAPALNFNVTAPVVADVVDNSKFVPLDTLYVHLPPPPPAVIVATLNTG